MGRIMKLVCFALVATAILASQRALALNIRDGKGNYAYKSYDGRDKLDGQTGGHWFNCGPTGIRASIDNTRLTEFLVQYVYPGSPADKKIVKGDRIIGANGKVWKVPDGMPQSDQAKNRKQGYHGPRMEIGKAVEESEGGSGARRGILTLMIIRGDKTINVDVPIRPIGAFSPTFPYNCEKTKLIVKEACEFLVKNGLRGCPNKRGHV